MPNPPTNTQEDCALRQWAAMEVVVEATTNVHCKNWVLQGSSSRLAVASSLHKLFVQGADMTVYSEDAHLVRASRGREKVRVRGLRCCVAGGGGVPGNLMPEEPAGWRGRLPAACQLKGLGQQRAPLRPTAPTSHRSPPPPQGIFVHLNNGGVSFKQPDDMLARELVSAINHHAAKRRALQEASDADSVALLVGTPP